MVPTHFIVKKEKKNVQCHQNVTLNGLNQEQHSCLHVLPSSAWFSLGMSLLHIIKAGQFFFFYPPQLFSFSLRFSSAFLSHRTLKQTASSGVYSHSDPETLDLLVYDLASVDVAELLQIQRNLLRIITMKKVLMQSLFKVCKLRSDVNSILKHVS